MRIALAAFCRECGALNGVASLRLETTELEANVVAWYKEGLRVDRVDMDQKDYTANAFCECRAKERARLRYLVSEALALRTTVADG
jgi:hypothetical protein